MAEDRRHKILAEAGWRGMKMCMSGYGGMLVVIFVDGEDDNGGGGRERRGAPALGEQPGRELEAAVDDRRAELEDAIKEAREMVRLETVVGRGPGEDGFAMHPEDVDVMNQYWRAVCNFRMAQWAVDRVRITVLFTGSRLLMFGGDWG
jgi:hypothetical protein